MRQRGLFCGVWLEVFVVGLVARRGGVLHECKRRKRCEFLQEGPRRRVEVIFHLCRKWEGSHRRDTQRTVRSPLRSEPWTVRQRLRCESSLFRMQFVLDVRFPVMCFQ